MAGLWTQCERATDVSTVAMKVSILQLWPSFAPVAFAEVLQGLTGGELGPAVFGINLGLAGYAKLAERLGLGRTAQ